jgi:outer membrane receptor protein involved in Fe transport
MNKFYTISFIFLIAIFSALPNLFAQSNVGKLAGRIIDTDTQEPLIGANVVLLGTELGAATDINGNYFILNIEPGEYDVKVSYVGYGEKVIQAVRIVGGITYELNVQLTSGIELREVVVTDKKLFEEKATNTVKVLDSDQINQLPVRGVEQLASLQAGVVMAEGSGGQGGNAVLNVRGGRGTEVTYIVDGVVQNDPLWGTNFSQVSNSAIEQLSFQVGGFEAKYGQSQSGIVSVTTKTGASDYSFFADVLSSTFTDDYGSNLYTVNLSGPLFPGLTNHTIFLSAERGWYLDGNPSAVGINFPSINYSSPVFPGESEGLWRYTGKITSNLGNQFVLRLSGNYNTRDFRGNVFGNGLGSTLADADYTFAKNNSEHIGKIVRDNLSLTAKLSQNLGSNSFYDITLGYKTYFQEQGDGVFFNRVEEYGDTLTNPYIPVQGDDATLAQDAAGIFAAKGYLENYYRKINNKTYSTDISFTSQVQNHLLEFGGGFNYNEMRYYSIGNPERLAYRNRDYIDANGDTTLALSRQERYEGRHPNRYGYDLYGDETSSGDLGPKNPILGYGYLQDRFELEDLVLNLGVRFDYFATRSKIFVNPELPYGGGSNPNDFDDGDFKTKDPEFYVSPRIGLGFPVTSTTVFHAQFGRFIQEPRLLDAILFETRGYLLQQTDNFQFNDGYINSEKTTQYEIGFRQILGNNAAALNITAFYKNIEGLTNTQARFWYRQDGGQQFIIFGATNSDFGTVKGLALTVDVPRVSYFSLSVNYTFSLAEGTGSSTNSSYVSAFRNVNGEIPKVISPLDFDQRHTGIVNLNFYVPEGDLGIFELTGVNVLFSFNSGRPYTPLETQDLTVDNTNYGQTKGYLNSAYGPGSFRVDLKLEKSFKFGNTLITPYVWVQNLFDADNAVRVWRSTGSPYTTGYLETEAGKTKSIGYGEEWKQDYMSLERAPSNFGIPRLINLGLKVNFSNL